MRVGREKTFRRRVDIGEIAAPAAGDQDLLADPLGVLDEQHPATALTGNGRTHQSGGAAAKNDDIVTLLCCGHGLKLPEFG